MIRIRSNLKAHLVIHHGQQVIPNIFPTLMSHLSMSSEQQKPPEHVTKKLFGNIASRLESALLRSGITADTDLVHLISRGATVGLVALAATSALGTLGVDIQPLIAGISVSGFAAGFAFKEIATNFISGTLLVLNKGFVKGQYLKVMSDKMVLEGIVTSIDARYVVLLTKDGNKLMIPSAIVYSSAILVGGNDVIK